MATIYGRSGAGKDLLRKCPSEIRKFGDIKISLTNLQNELTCKRANFFENLPRVITEERDLLENIKKEAKEIEDLWDERIGAIKEIIENKKIKICKEFKIYLLFALPLNYLDLFIKVNISKNKALKRVRNDIKNHNNKVHLFENEPEKVFKNEHKELIYRICELEDIINSPEYLGTYGEIRTLHELKKLGEDFHVVCDVKIALPNYVSYNGNHNLKSARMDFVVVGPTGIIVIEVKNWSSAYRDNHKGISPHEQVDRAGRVLYKYLDKYPSLRKPKITQLLVPIQCNLHYDKKYKHVLVCDPPKVREFIENNNSVLPSENINKVISLLNV